MHPIATGLEKSAIKLSVLLFLQCNLVQNAFKSQKMCNKDVDSCPSVLNYVLDHYLIQVISDKVVSKEPFMISSCLDRYQKPKTCDKAVNSYLLVWKFVLDWFVFNKIIEKHDNGVFSNDDIIIGDTDSDIATFFINDIGLNSINFKNVNPGNFEDCDPETINHVRFMSCFNRYKQHQAL